VKCAAAFCTSSARRAAAAGVGQHAACDRNLEDVAEIEYADSGTRLVQIDVPTSMRSTTPASAGDDVRFLSQLIVGEELRSRPGRPSRLQPRQEEVVPDAAGGVLGSFETTSRPQGRRGRARPITRSARVFLPRRSDYCGSIM